MSDARLRPNLSANGPKKVPRRPEERKPEGKRLVSPASNTTIMIIIFTGNKEAAAGSFIVAVALVYLADKHALQPVRSHNERVPARISAFFKA